MLEGLRFPGQFAGCLFFIFGLDLCNLGGLQNLVHWCVYNALFNTVPFLKLTCPLKVSGWKMKISLKWSLFRGHVNIPGAMSM